MIFFFQAEDGIRDVLGSRGLGDVYKRQQLISMLHLIKLVMNENELIKGILLWGYH